MANSGGIDIPNKIAARSALLEFYSNKAVSFGGFFLASIFGLLTMLTLVQGIRLGETIFATLFVVFSLVPFFVFALIGYHSLQRFSFYANIADKIEGGAGGTGTLRHYARLSELEFMVNENGELVERNLQTHIEQEDAKQKKTWGKRIMGWITRNSRNFKLSYSILILFLIIVAYIPRFLF